MTWFNTLKNTLFFAFLLLFSCAKGQKQSQKTVLPQRVTVTVAMKNNENAVVGANQTGKYLPLLQGKKVAVVANPTSVIFNKKGYTHLVDSLVANKVNVVKVFAPEHGFRGTADAGEHVKDGVDQKTGIPIMSLYGKNRKPSAESLQGINVVVFDIQDVGVRFYTYISTLHYVMEACAEQHIPVIILDRPNPNGFYVDGPVLEPAHTSFVGMDPIPLVHGMTIGEYGKMLNGEHWLKGGIQCNLTVITCKNYNRKESYHLPIKPSPNLPNDKAINLYPSLGLFEGTNVNAGRGTHQQFQRYGASFLNHDVYSFTYTPEPNDGAKHPKEEGKVCYGKDLSKTPQLAKVDLKWLVDAYHNCTDKTKFFIKGFTIHAGTEKLQQQIEQGMSAEAIAKTWKGDLDHFKTIRAKYLLYPDF
ncbi:exo-beta-N-acetylmuramidase NamZ domain-containing protein [Zhouia sp. PK063]|uniref:exo-beta-N-acetylmuramidase NamZ family protein n=1 Tax=Zhouia sp. PK063 TaxID=3373602 RepID=UPI00378F3D71